MEILFQLPVLVYETERLQTPFTTSAGVRYNESVRITFLDNLGKSAHSKVYGLADVQHLYEQIKKGEHMDCSEAYVNDFSLNAYRRQNGMAGTDSVTLVNVTAKDSFFDCSNTIDFSYARFTGKKTQFDGSVFGNGTLDFSYSEFCEGNSSFRETVFGRGKKSFSDVQFGGGDVVFRKAKFFDGLLSFVNTRFGAGMVDFSECIITNGDVLFEFSKFSGGDVIFDRASFGIGKKDFKAVEFGNGKIDFRRCNFGDGLVTFEGAEFGSGKKRFRHSVFGKGVKTFQLADFGSGEVNFEGCDFGSGKMDFKGARVETLVLRDAQLDCYFDLRFAACDFIDLSDTIVRDIINLRSRSNPVKMKGINLSGMKLMGKIFIVWEVSDVKNLIYHQPGTSMRQKADQFLTLKGNFNSYGEYSDEDAAYIEFKRCEALADREAALQKNDLNKIFAWPVYIFKLLMFDKMGAYATDPLKVLRSVFVFYLLYSLLYFILPGISSEVFGYLEGPEKADLLTSYYFSAVTFFTIGFGDYRPVGMIRLFAGAEGFFGVFMMSYFTVAFARKILR